MRHTTSTMAVAAAAVVAAATAAAVFFTVSMVRLRYTHGYGADIILTRNEPRINPRIPSHVYGNHKRIG